MATIEIYTKAFCPFCTQAKRLLDGKEAAYEEYDITLSKAKREEMIARADGRSTVPQIFIDDRPIGGADDLIALDREGGLDPLLSP